jgi:TPR repeat protein
MNKLWNGIPEPLKKASTVAQNSLESLYHARDLSVAEKGSLTPNLYSKNGLCSKLHSDISNIPEFDGLERLQQLAVHCMRADGHAILAIGKRYLQGNRLPQDMHAGFKWTRNAAKAGLNEARRTLAQMYKNGDCIDQDYHKASIWYMKAAKNGDDKAQYEIGFMYHHGLGVRKDPLEAIKWYTFSADKNNSDAQCQLGILREYGEGLNQDTDEAIALYHMAIKQKNPYAIFKIAQTYEGGSGLKSNIELALKFFGIGGQSWQLGCSA